MRLVQGSPGEGRDFDVSFVTPEQIRMVRKSNRCRPLRYVTPSTPDTTVRSHQHEGGPPGGAWRAVTGSGVTHGLRRRRCAGRGHTEPGYGCGPRRHRADAQAAVRRGEDRLAGPTLPQDLRVPAARVQAQRLYHQHGRCGAKARVSQSNCWHAHAEIPYPVTTGSRLWLEIEDPKGGSSVGNFHLKM